MPTYPPNATFTPRLGLPRPGLDDIADGPDGFFDLTDVLDPIVAAYASGTTAARPAPGTSGRFYWNTDTKTLEFDNGTAWVKAGGSAVAGTALPILDVGVPGQTRAGRQLAVADFTALGLAPPIGLWNLSDLSNLGSDARALANKGGVPFGVGINGAAATAAVFSGSASQALSIPDSGAADPLRITAGSWGCWFRTAKRGTVQHIFTKMNLAATARSFEIYVATNNSVGAVAFVDPATTSAAAGGVTDVCDDRWHFVAATFDGGALRFYVDGLLEATGFANGAINGSSGPFNIGAFGGDSATAPGNPFFGRVDEAFVTSDVLSEDQIRLLYAVKMPHGLAAPPTGVRVNVHRKRKGAALAVADFTTQPLRLHNFTAGSLADEGSGAVALANSGAVSVAGADGARAGAFSFPGTQSLFATDTGLPAALASRSYGCWFKTATQAAGAECGHPGR
jgi:hypothetical protein